MNLQELDSPVCWDTPPREILRTIETAERLRDKMKSDPAQKRIPMLVNSNYYIAYNALKHVIDTGRASDLTFCEWGSGLGVVTCIASQLGFHATGIEIEESLCDFARSLAKEAGVKADFFQGSYRHQEGESQDNDLSTNALPFPLGHRSADVIFAYPWPAEEAFIATLFRQSAASNPILITYHGGTTLRVREKVQR